MNKLEHVVGKNGNPSRPQAAMQEMDVNVGLKLTHWVKFKPALTATAAGLHRCQGPHGHTSPLVSTLSSRRSAGRAATVLSVGLGYRSEQGLCPASRSTSRPLPSLQCIQCSAYRQLRGARVVHCLRVFSWEPHPRGADSSSILRAEIENRAGKLHRPPPNCDVCIFQCQASLCAQY